MWFGGYQGAHWQVQRKIDQTPTADVKQLDEPPGPVSNYLIVGSDTREFVDEAGEAKAFGSQKKVGGQRADVIMIARVDPEARAALVVSIPRDTWVSVPGLGKNKINAAYLAGPDRVIETIDKNFDIPIHHYLEVNFEGFRNIVDAIGGVRMYVPSPSRDSVTGLRIPTAGCQTLDGVQALAWARSRSFQHYESGRWKTDPTADIGRIGRQQTFIRALLQQAVRAGMRNPVKANSFVNTALESVKRDRDLSSGDVFKLARVFRSSDPSVVEMVAMPHKAGRGPGSVEPSEEAEAIFARLRGDVPVSPEDSRVIPADVSIRVLNGTGAPGEAGQALADLGARGFGAAGSGDATAYGVKATLIRYPKGREAEARLVARYLLGVGRLVEDTELREDVVLVTGEDFRGIAQRADEDVAPSTTTSPLPVGKPQGAEQPAC